MSEVEKSIGEFAEPWELKDEHDFLKLASVEEQDARVNEVFWILSGWLVREVLSLSVEDVNQLLEMYTRHLKKTKAIVLMSYILFIYFPWERP